MNRILLFVIGNITLGYINFSGGSIAKGPMFAVINLIFIIYLGVQISISISHIGETSNTYDGPDYLKPKDILLSMAEIILGIVIVIQYIRLIVKAIIPDV